ncbi:hypothetical protein ACQ4PT_007548 [Festuca glaucescens]
MSTAVHVRAKRRFRFEHFWLKIDGFLDVVKQCWSDPTAPVDPLRRLGYKLRKLSRELQCWSQRHVGSIKQLLLIAHEVILKFDVAQESRNLSADKLQLRKMLKHRVLRLASLEQTIVRQRARVASLSDSDASSQFFRIYAAKRSQRNHIASIRSGDRIASEHGDKEEVATNFFVDLLGKVTARGHGIALGELGLPMVELDGLEAQFSEDETWATIRSMPSSKSPGTDGFTWEFFQVCWEVVKGDIMTALHAIFSRRDQFFDGLNNALITLVAKKEVALEMKDYRPISLVHSIGKLLAKILAIHLSPKMPELIDNNQSAFIKGRCIQDNFVLVQQGATALHRRKVLALLLKLDIARAFDSVAWPFLLQVMQHRGFGTRWTRWILLLLRSAMTRVLVNGCAGSAFRHGCGLRQGDPLSPLLFVLVMDVLARLFSTTEHRGVLADLSAVGIKHRVSLYADDVVVFAKPEVAEVAAVRGIMECFGGASGLCVNFNKSAAAPIRCPPQVLADMAAALDCPISTLPCNYLGLPLSIQRLTKRDLQLVLDKLANKLTFWKAKLLTKEGRVTYVQAIMTASVIYQLLALDLEPWFFHAVDKLRRGFLWAGRHEARGGNCLVAWDLVYRLKRDGGLGFHNLRTLNIALRTKWKWLLKTDQERPWAGMSVKVMPEANALLNASVSISVGDGAKLLFWEDPWINGLDASATAPAIVAMVKPRFRNNRRSSRGGTTARGPETSPGGLDVIRCKWTASGDFLARSAYHAQLAGSTSLTGAANVWHAFAPMAYKFHAWLALRQRCWTADRLARHGLPSHAIYPLCKVDDETLDHLSLLCPFARQVWSGVDAALGYNLPLPTVGLADWWPESVNAMTKRRKKEANSLIMLVLRSLWLERNARVFDSKESAYTSILASIINTWQFWISCRGRLVRDVL